VSLPSSDYLSLRLIHLTSFEEWLNRGKSFSLLFPKGGFGTFVSPAIKHPLAPGDVLVLTQSQGGKVCPADGGELAFSYFSLCLEHLYPLFGSAELSLLQEVTEVLRTPRLYPTSSPLAQECHRLLAAAPAQHHLGHRGQLLRIVTAILAVEFKDARHQRGGVGGADEHMVQVLEELLVEDIMGLTAVELAEKFHCSPRHLNRLFHQHFGFPVATLKMEMRLIKAITLLRNRDAKVIEVAEQCGFNHTGLFNTCFKRRFGASPGHWRDANLPADAHPTEMMQSDLRCHILSNGLCPWAGKSAGSRPANPKSAGLKPASPKSGRLREVRSPLSPLAPQRPDPSVNTTARANLEAAVVKRINALVSNKLEAFVVRKLEAAVAAKLNAACPSQSEQDNGS
jgi:AraC-like DNA-binding protein